MQIAQAAIPAAETRTRRASAANKVVVPSVVVGAPLAGFLPVRTVLLAGTPSSMKRLRPGRMQDLALAHAAIQAAAHRRR